MIIISATTPGFAAISKEAIDSNFVSVGKLQEKTVAATQRSHLQESLFLLFAHSVGVNI